MDGTASKGVERPTRGLCGARQRGKTVIERKTRLKTGIYETRSPTRQCNYKVQRFDTGDRIYSSDSYDHTSASHTRVQPRAASRKTTEILRLRNRICPT